MAIAQYKQQSENYWQTQFKDSKKELENAINSNYLTHVKKYSKKSDIIVEGGCSTGRFIQALVSLGYKNSLGFEIDKKLYKIAKNKKLNVKLGSVLEIPYKKNFADLYLDAGVIEHFSFKDQNKILKEINRILKKKGILITGFAYMNWFRKLISPYMYFKNLLSKSKGIPFHQWIYSKRDMEKLLIRNGFTPLLFDQYIFPRAIIIARKIEGKVN